MNLKLLTCLTLAVAGLAACGGAAVPSSAPASSPSVAAPASKPAAPASAAVSASGAAPASAVAKPSGAAPASKPAAAGSLPHLTVAATPAINSAGAYIGIDRGYFHDAGVDVEVVPFAGGAQQISSIAASQVDMGITDPGAGVFNALSRDLPMKFVADAARCGKGHCNSALLVRKALVDQGQFKDMANLAKDLKGKAVNPFTPGSSLNLQMNRVLDKAGLKESDVNMKNVQFDQLFAAFANGSLDVSWSIEPFTTQIIAQGAAVKFSDTFELFGPAQSTIVIFSPTMETQKQDLGKKFMVGYLRGVRDYIDAFDSNKDYDAIVAILAKNTTLKDPAVYKKITVPTFDPNGEILVDQIQANEDLYVKRGDIKSPTPVASIYDRQYIDAAVAQLGKR